MSARPSPISDDLAQYKEQNQELRKKMTLFQKDLNGKLRDFKGLSERNDQLHKDMMGLQGTVAQNDNNNHKRFQRLEYIISTIQNSLKNESTTLSSLP